MSVKRPFHPLLFALYPVLSLYSLNTALIPISDVPVPALVVIAGTAIFWLVLALLLRSVTRAAVGASIAVVSLFTNGHIWNLAVKSDMLRHFFYNRDGMFQYWTGVVILAVVAACWKWKREEQIMAAMNIGGIVLAGFPVLSIALSLTSAWLGTGIKSVGSVSAKLDTSVRPDIYYIILDGYGRTDALERVIGVSNTWFVNALKDRGFFIADNARSNYCETELSLASSLNLDYLPKLIPNMRADWEDRKVLDSLIDRNGVSKYLRKLGYRYEAMTSGFPAVHPSSADVWVQDSRGASLFAGVLISETPFWSSEGLGGMSQFTARRILLRSALANAAKTTVGVMQPKFVFVHVLAPHPPFVFGPNGEAIRPKLMGFSIVDGSHFYDNGGTPAEYTRGYAGQVTYISKLVLDTVDQILKKPGTRPVIILQGDHGSKLKLDQELLEKTDVNECFPNLNAFLVPPKVRGLLYDGITPVNSFRLIFNGLFGDEFPRLPDRSYYSSWTLPFRFTEVTARIKNRPPTESSPSSGVRP